MTDRHLDLAADRLAAAAACRLQEAGDRRRRGVFFTPPDVAAALADQVVERGTVLDPACGGGAFLLAAARRLLAVGTSDRRSIVRGHLFGADVDPASVAATRRILGAWADVDSDEVAGVVVADPLRDGASAWPDRPVDGFDAVVGNPPFLGQLRASTSRTGGERLLLKERFGGLVAAYTDAAWLFLALGMDVLAPGGRMVLIQPQSLLSARDAGPVRDLMVTSGRLVGLWLDRSGVFAGHAEVCAPVVERRARCHTDRYASSSTGRPSLSERCLHRHPEGRGAPLWVACWAFPRWGRWMANRHPLGGSATGRASPPASGSTTTPW